MLGRPWWHHRVQGRRPQCALPHLCLSLLICEAGQDSPQSRAEVGLCGSSAFPAHSCPLHLGLLPRAPRWACGCGERMGQGAGISPTDKEGGAEGRAQRQGGGLPLAVCAAHAGQGNHVQLSLPLLLNHVGFPSLLPQGQALSCHLDGPQLPSTHQRQRRPGRGRRTAKV